MRVSVLLLGILRCTCCLSSCPYGWTPYGSSCYGLSHIKMSWAEAQATCLSFQGHIAAMETLEESTFVSNLAKTKGNKELYWLGASDLFTFVDYIWSTTVESAEDSGNWKSGQPNRFDGAAGVDRCVLIGPPAYQWVDYPCNGNMRFICEKETGDEEDYCST